MIQTIALTKPYCPGVAIRLDLSVLNREGRRGGRPGAPIGHHLASGRRAAGHSGWRRGPALPEADEGRRLPGLLGMGSSGVVLRLVGNVKALREGERLTTVPLLVNS
jgi:hypothetical protein